jgi:hypothetical protein
MLVLLILIGVLLLFGGIGFHGRGAGWEPRAFGGLILALLMIILLIWVVNELLMPPLPMPVGAPSIIR